MEIYSAFLLLCFIRGFSTFPTEEPLGHPRVTTFRPSIFPFSILKKSYPSLVINKNETITTRNNSSSVGSISHEGRDIEININNEGALSSNLSKDPSFGMDSREEEKKSFPHSDSFYLESKTPLTVESTRKNVQVLGTTLQEVRMTNTRDILVTSTSAPTTRRSINLDKSVSTTTTQGTTTSFKSTPATTLRTTTTLSTTTATTPSTTTLSTTTTNTPRTSITTTTTSINPTTTTPTTTKAYSTTIRITTTTTRITSLSGETTSKGEPLSPEDLPLHKNSLIEDYQNDAYWDISRDREFQYYDEIPEKKEEESSEGKFKLIESKDSLQNSMTIVIKPNKYVNDAMIHLKYERISMDPTDEIEQVPEKIPFHKMSNLQTFPLLSDTNEHYLDNLEAGWYLVCAEVTKRDKVMEKDCFRARIFEKTSTPIQAGVIVLIIFGTLVIFLLSLFIIYTKVQSSRRKKKDKELQDRVEKMAQKERELNEKQKTAFHHIYVDPDEP